VAHFTTEAEYYAMTHSASEIMWVWSLLHEVQIMFLVPMKIYYDNQSSIFIASNLVFHEHIKHIDVDCHFIRDLTIKKPIVTPYVQSEDQLGDILTKSLARSLFSFLYSKLGIFNLYAPD